MNGIAHTRPPRHLRSLALLLFSLAAHGLAADPRPDAPPSDPPPGRPILDVYISTGDNHWLGSWLPIDSPASIDASFDLLSRLGVRRVYWRGLQEATWLETMRFREENCRYASFWRYLHELDRVTPVDRLAVEAAHRRGMQIWGVGTMFDWGAAADTPCFGDFPHNSESRLRIEHPEWVPVDRRGALRQGGPIEFAYPAARQALVDLHMKIMRRDGYDGMALLTYVENFHVRFPDEFGYCEPAALEFKRRTGRDPRHEPFEMSATRYDWQSLRGEFVTRYLRELKGALAADGKGLGVCVGPNQPRLPQNWPSAGARTLSGIAITAGHIRFDLETWVREGIVDQLLVWGACHGPTQCGTVEDLLWLTRETSSGVTAMTSSPFAERWAPFHARGVPMLLAVGEDAAYLLRSNIPAQPPAALRGDGLLPRMRALAQVAAGEMRAPVAELAPLARDPNLIVRRLALAALGKTRDPGAPPILEEALSDPENCIRCMAAVALRESNRPESVGPILAAIGRHPAHPLMEAVVPTLARIQPPPRAELSAAAGEHPHPAVRVVAIRALGAMPDARLVPTFAQGLRDPDRHVRFWSAFGLGNIRRDPVAIETLIEATGHDDPVVSDRAATSLGLCAARGAEPETVSLRPRMIEALRSLYAKLGDGCARSDIDWGYRPVGNALLKFGEEGERALVGFLEQRADRRLAEQAWKSLFLRMDNGVFHEIDERENDEAFARRPVFDAPSPAGPAGDPPPTGTPSPRPDRAPRS